MSPEQAKGDPLDARTDLFSLGSVLFEMATGQAPFGGRSTAEVFAALLMKDPPPVSSLNPAMPSALDAIIAKLLAKNRDQRYGSAEELLADLEAASGAVSPPGVARAATTPSTPPVSVPPSVPQASGRPLRSRMIVIGALLLVALAGGVLSVPQSPWRETWLSTRRRNQRDCAVIGKSAGKARDLERQHHRRRLHQQDR